jgi:hypothetical protein
LFFSRYIKSHHVSRAALIAAGTAAAILFFIVGAAIRLLVGPLSLGPLGNTLPNAIAEALPGVRVQYDTAAIQWSRDQSRVNLVILGARVFDDEGRIIAQAPEADIDLAAGPLLQGKAVVTRITLVGVQLTLVRTVNGGLRLGIEKDKSQHDILSRISDAITLRSDKSSALQAFAIRHARLAFYDEPTGLFFVAPKANFRVMTAGSNLAASFDAALEISGHPAHVTGEFTIPPKKGPVKGAIAFTGLDLRALGTESASFAKVRHIGLAVDASASFVVQGVHLISVDFGATAKGAIDVPGLEHGPLQVRSIQVVGRYEGATGRLLVDDATLKAAGTSAHLTGQAELIRDAAGLLSRVRYEAIADKISISMPGVLPAPVSLRTISARGDYWPELGKIAVDQLSAGGGPLSFQARGSILLIRGKAPAIDATGQLGAIGIRDLMHYWPLRVGTGARAWIDKNIFAGSMGAVQFEAHFPAGMLDADELPDEALKVTIPLFGIEANYLQGLTHLSQLRGLATLTGDTFSAKIESGRIGAIALNQGRVVITSLHIPESPGAFAAHVSGSMPDILALVNMKPLNYATRFGINVAETRGSAGIDLSFRMPMRKDLRVDDVGIAINAKTTGFAIPIGEHARLSDGVVNFTISNAKLHANGTATLADSKLAIDWNEDFRTSDPVTTRIQVKGSLDAGSRSALNFRASDFLKGPTPMTARLLGHRGALSSADMTLDLTPSVLGLDLIGLRKPAGTAASAQVTATFGPDSTIRTETLSISGPGIAANGSATFDKAGHLTQLTFPAVRFGPANDFSFALARSQSGQEISIRGKSLDGSRFAGQGRKSQDAVGGSGGAEALEGPFHIAAKLDRVILREGVNIASFSLDVTGVGDRPATLSMSGSLSRTASISGEITSSDGGRRMTFTTNDAGLLARGLLGFTSLKGGRVDLTATLPGKATDIEAKDGSNVDYQGKLTARDFKVLNQPFLTRLFSAGSLDGLINLMQDKGIAVDKFEIPFSSKGGVIDVKEARATGPAIGLTADGYVDRPKNVIAMKGTLVPLFGLNSVLGSIPIVGDVLVSKKGEGIFGMTYSISGNADQPSVGVNPLSVLTPGIFRRIFEGKMPNSAQAPSNQARQRPAPTAPSAPPPKP